MYSSIYRVQSSTRRLPIWALFGFTLKQSSPIFPFLSESLVWWFVLGSPWVTSEEMQVKTFCWGSYLAWPSPECHCCCSCRLHHYPPQNWRSPLWLWTHCCDWGKTERKNWWTDVAWVSLYLCSMIGASYPWKVSAGSKVSPIWPAQQEKVSRKLL